MLRTTPRTAAILAALSLLLALLAPQRGRADGYYAALDWSRSQPTAVVSLEKGPWTMVSALGRGTDDLLWTKAALLRVWTVGPVRLKLGPSLYFKEWPEWMKARPENLSKMPFDHAIGLRLGADSYKDRGDWASYWMVEYDSTRHSTLALVSADWKASGIGAELSVWREAGEKPAESTAAASAAPETNTSEV